MRKRFEKPYGLFGRKGYEFTPLNFRETLLEYVGRIAGDNLLFHCAGEGGP